MNELNKRVIDYALEAFTSRGIKAVTMDSIASALGISKRTLYGIFSSKEDLITGVIYGLIERRKEYARELIASKVNPVEMFFKMSPLSVERSNIEEIFFHEVKCNYPAVLMKFEYMWEDWIVGTRALMEEGAKQGYYYENLDFDKFVDFMFNIDIQITSRLEIDKILESHKYGTVLFIRAMATPKGIEEINRLCKENNIIITRDEKN